MNTVEEKIWNYIDGTCTPAELEAIRLLILQDNTYRLKYEELSVLNSEFAGLELDEPSMAFTYNVMEGIRKENALKPLKAAVDKRIIRGIGLFFIIVITATLVFALAQVNWMGTQNSPVGFKFTMPNMTPFLAGPLMQVFWFFDIVLALYLADHYFRSKRITKSDISVQTGGQHDDR